MTSGVVTRRPATKRDGNPTALELAADLGPCPVDDDDLVPGLVQLQRVTDRGRRDASSELQDEAHYVVYSALSLT